MKLLDAVAAVFQSRYRPEAYYMRGPGPAWAAKHQVRETAADEPRTGDDAQPSPEGETSAR